MKKLTVWMFVSVWIFWMAGCQRTIRASDVYTFSEAATQITGSFYTQGPEGNFAIGLYEDHPDDLSAIPVIAWFYGLELRECEEPEPVEGNASYSFLVDGQPAFTYDSRGSEAFLVVNDRWYAVANPSDPPVGAADEHEVVAFHGQRFNKSALSQETLEWLAWYHSLSPAEQLAVSSIPAELYDGNGAGTVDADAEGSF